VGVFSVNSVNHN